MASRPLEGLLVVSMEQAVAAPYCASRLADRCYVFPAHPAWGESSLRW